jgi:hypothetical protein
MRIRSGSLALLADIIAAIDACDAARPDCSEPLSADRAVLADDGTTITLALYTGAGAVGSVSLSPRRTVALAAELIAAALRRLP